MSIDSHKTLASLPYKSSSTFSDWDPLLPSLSLDRSQSLLTRTTSSSYSTVWGPGAHTGRALKAFGDAVKNAILIVAVNTWLATQRALIGNRSKLDALDDGEYCNLCVELADLTRAHWGMSIRLSALRLVKKLLIAPKSSVTPLRTLHTFVGYGLFKDLYLGVPNDIVLTLRQTIVSTINAELPQREACQLFVLRLQAWLKHPRKNIPPPLSIPDLPAVDKATISRSLMEAGIGHMLSKALNPDDGPVWMDILHRSPWKMLEDKSLSTISRPSTEMAPPSSYTSSSSSDHQPARRIFAGPGGFVLGELMEEPEIMAPVHGRGDDELYDPPAVDLRLSSFDTELDVSASIGLAITRDDSLLSEVSTLSPDEWLAEQEKIMKDPSQLDAMDPTDFLSFCESLVELTNWTGQTRIAALQLVHYLLEHPKFGLDAYQLLVLFVMNGLFSNLQPQPDMAAGIDKDSSDDTTEELNSLISKIISERMDVDLEAKKLYIQHLRVIFGMDMDLADAVHFQDRRRVRIRWNKSQGDV